MRKQMVLPWLDPAEQKDVCQRLLDWGFIKYSNRRDLPLKSGGTTDIYINLRDARNQPDAIRYIANLFADPLRRLGVRRFVEIPDAVSCFAGPLSIETGLPYLTIREQAKTGRVAKATYIGSPCVGEDVAIIDDVVTDGESKIVPYRECLRMGINPGTLAVLVDREQGWRNKFTEAQIGMSVWPGMTLHDVRCNLISTFGVMERCDPAVEEKNPLIVALDGRSWDEVLPVIDQLRITGCILKVNDLLFNKGLEWLLPNLQVYGRVMVDLKGHDIPNTLENTAKHLLRNPPWAVTVHASGGEEMIRKVVNTLAGTPTKVLVITVLTSLDANACKEIYGCKLFEQVEKLAAIAQRAGAHGLVCSPLEVKMLRHTYRHGMTLVVPGVRSPGAEQGDQKRTDTPLKTRDAGAADYLVMGRQLFGAKDPVAEARRVLVDELKIVL